MKNHFSIFHGLVVLIKRLASPQAEQARDKSSKERKKDDFSPWKPSLGSCCVNFLTWPLILIKEKHLFISI
jgi:hypothetical protein